MAAREQDAIDALREAEKLLVNHRGFVRARPRGDRDAENADEHERVTQAIHRTREALAHLAPYVPELGLRPELAHEVGR